MAAPATRWGICSAGKISHDFVSALASLPKEEHVVQAVAARDVTSAKNFANIHGIPSAYGSYDELVADSNVDVVYVGSINTQHAPLIKLAINQGKHVLCEKPIAMNVRETKEVVELARAKKVLLMEGVWSRNFPAYKRLAEMLKAGDLGKIRQLSVNFGANLTRKDRCSLKALGGGSLLDIGIYCVQLATFVFGPQMPVKIVSAGHLNADGVDESSSTTLVYPDGKLATLVVNGSVVMDSAGQIAGTKGVVTLPHRFWCPTEMVTPNGVEKFELPPTTKTYNYANSVGLCYQAVELRRCLLAGLIESPTISLDDSLTIAEIMESIRKQLGVEYPQDLA